MDEFARLEEAVGRGEFSRASHFLISIKDHLGDDLSQDEIDKIIINLFAANQQRNIVQMIKQNISHADFGAEGLDLISVLIEKLDNVEKKLDLESIVALCLTILRANCAVKLKEKCFPLLDLVVEKTHSTLVSSIVKVITIHIKNKTEKKATIIAKEFELMGKISKKYPELIDHEIIGAAFLKTIEEYTNEKVKLSFPLLEGCFNGLVEYLHNFFEPYMAESIYRSIKKFSDPGDLYRRGHARAALRLLTKHGENFGSYLFNDFKFWHSLLLKWIKQSYAEDRKVGYSGLFSFYNSIGNEISRIRSSPQTLHCLEYFNKYFKTIFEEKLNRQEVSLVSEPYDIKYALKGYTVLVSKCKDYYNEQEFHEISNIITQRALLHYKEYQLNDISITKEATEETTEKIEELCNHVDALAALEMNTNYNLENLVCILLADFPKCMSHRRYIIKSTVIHALQTADIPIIVSQFIQESCKHCVSTNLYNGVDTQNSPITFQTFMPLWKDILEFEHKTSNQTYDEFMRYVAKNLPIFNISTKVVSIDQEGVLCNDIESFGFDCFEVPESFSDYRFFHNLCDLTASIMALPWTHEWSFKWIEKILKIIIKGRKKSSNALGFITIGEVLLKIIKKVAVNTSILSEIQQTLLGLLNDISITSGSEAFQLRAALLFLQAPPSIINISLIDKAIYALKAILKVGKNNLMLVSNVLEILEEWNDELQKDMFDYLCIEILPQLNEYLCSSGISDTNIISKISNTSGSVINQELATLQRKIILFFGKIDAKIIKSGLKSTAETNDFNDCKENVIIFSDEKFKISLPYLQQQKLDIYLDSLLPRIKELALKSSNRDTRLTACQTLHSFILIVYGTCVQLPPTQKLSLINVYSELFTSMIYLSADMDSCISNMFSPLLKQSCHWFSSSHQYQSDEAQCFVEVLLKCASNPLNLMMQDVSCQVLNELISWTTEKCSVKQLMDVPSNIASILESISQKMLHPDEIERNGAFIIFNSIFKNIFKLDDTINKYFLNILYSIIKSISKFSGKTSEPAYKSLENMLMCLEVKYNLFKINKMNRILPPNFKNGAVLGDICLWLLQQGKAVTRKVTEKCFATFLNIYKKNSLVKVQHEMESNFADINKKYFEWENILGLNDSNVEGNMEILQNLSNSIENYIFLLKNREIFDRFLCQYNSLDSDLLKAISSLITIQLSNEREKILQSKTLWKSHEFILLSSTSNFVIFKSFFDKIGNDIVKSIISMIVDDSSNISSEDNMKKVISTFMIAKTDVWPLFEDHLSNELKNNHYLEFLQEENFSFDNEISTDYMEKIIYIINIMSNKKKKELLLNYQLSNILQKIFHEQKCNRRNQVIDKYLNFVLSLDSTLCKDLIIIIGDENVQSAMSCGRNFYNKFEMELTKYFINNSNDFFCHLSLRLSETNVNNYIDILQIIIKSEAIKEFENDLVREFCKNIHKFHDTFWADFSIWKVHFDKMLRTFSLLMTLHDSKMYFEKTENKLAVWLLESLSNPNYNIKNKTLMIALLPAVLKPGKGEFWYKNILGSALDSIHYLLPQSNKKEHRENQSHIDLIKSLLKAMANSGSCDLFMFVLKHLLYDSNYICEEEITLQFKIFFNLMIDEQIFIIKELFDLLRAPSLDSKLVLNLLNRFLLPLLSQTNSSILESFYIENISAISKMGTQKFSSSMSESKCKRLFVDWISAYKILEMMIVKLPFEVIDLEDSKIALGYYESVPKKGMFIKDIFKIPYQRFQQKTEINCSELCTELLRMSQCAAFTCLYSIITARKKDMNFFKILLDATWENLIDGTKNYTFSLVTDGKTKTKSHLLPLKNDANPTSYFNHQSFINVSTKTGDLRQQLLSQTLREDILKFDLNGTQNCTNAYGPINNIQKVFLLDDDELNNHECMAITCQLMHDLNELTNDDNPKWLDSIIKFLQDKKINKNVRLFFSRVVDNVRSIFKRYAVSLFIPMLSVIQDRCTAYDSYINHQDFSILSLMLSWSDVIVPKSRDQILMASSILQFVIEQIDPQRHYTHCLQLTNAIVAAWGKSDDTAHLLIPYDLIINKKDLKIMAIFLSNNIPSWNEDTIVKHKEFLISVLNSNNKKEYKSVSEVTGLTLKLLSDTGEEVSFENILKIKIEDFYNKGEEEKFINCLSNIQKYHANFLNESMITKVSYLIPRVPKDFKNMCLDIFLRSVDPVPNECLTSLKMDDLIREKSFRISALKLFEKSLSLDTMDLCKDIKYICDLVNNKDRECREISFKILEKLFTLYKTQNENLKIKNHQLTTHFHAFQRNSRKRIHDDNIGSSAHIAADQMSNDNDKLYNVQLALMCGLDDDENALKEKITYFWSMKYSHESIQDRWISVCLEFLNNGCSGKTSILGQIIRIILSHCSCNPELNATKCFEHPLEECTFENYDWKFSNKKQSIPVPIFLETLNSEYVMSSVIQQTQQGKNISRNDIQTLDFMTSTCSFIKPQQTILKNSLQSLSESFYNNHINVTENQEILTHDYLRKKETNSKTQRNIKFSGISERKKRFLKIKSLKEKSLQSFKNFRNGDYPDIQILIKDIFSPLMELIARDFILAKDFFIILFKSISKANDKKSRSENFNSSTLKILVNCMKKHTQTGLETPLCMSLLEICRLSLDESEDIENFDRTINQIGKICDINWFVTLILEEKEIKTVNRTAKRLKESYEADKYFDEIHSSMGNHLELQKIYAKAALDEELSEDLRTNFTEKYFEGFAELSDWNGFLEQIQFQYSSNDEPFEINTFNYDNLWNKTWMKNSLLSLMFHANVHLLANSEENEATDRFNEFVNTWISDAEKNQFMKANIPVQLALWKMIRCEKNSRTLFANDAFEWLKNKWMQDYMSQINFKGGKSEIFIMLQMIGEFCSILEMPVFSGSISTLNTDVFHKSLDKIIGIWKNCNPLVSEKLDLWELRLACRSVLAHRLQKIKNELIIDGNEESMLNKIQRFSKLHLVKAAVASNNPSLAGKIVNQLLNLEDDEEISWSLQLALIDKVKAINEKKLDIKLNSLIDAWKLGENLRSRFSESKDPISYIGFLHNSASISNEIFKMFLKKKNIDSNVLISEIFTLGKFSPYASDDINISLIKYSEKYLKDGIDIIENHMNSELMLKQAEFVSSAYLLLAKFYKDVDEHKVLKSNMGTFVKCLLKSMVYGNIEARKMFPILLTKFEELSPNDGAFETFKNEVANLPSWFFLPWVSQLLAHFPTLKHLLFDLILIIATDYPQGMAHQYRLSKRMWLQNSELYKMNDVIDILDQKLLDSNLEQFVEALSCVVDPFILLKSHLENIIRISVKNNHLSLKTAFHDLFEEVFPSSETIKAKVRGPIFQQIVNFIPELKEIERFYESSKDIPKTMMKIQIFLEREKLDLKGNICNHRNLKDFSPFLSKFNSDVCFSSIDIFGQYNSFQSIKPTMYISVAKLDPEVVAIKSSLRRPIRIGIIGSNGKRYRFLIKRGEDLRQDERIQQLFCLMNDFLIENSLNITTYKITPLSWDCGIIEWLHDSATLKDVLCKSNPDVERLITDLRNVARNHVLKIPGDNLAIRYGNMAANINKTISIYKNELVSCVPKYLFRDALFKLAISPENFVHMRDNYINSLSSMSISQWILGIGDRHLSNSLLCIKTGRLVGIDFGYAFGTATQFLSLPELLPFRLTHQLVNVMAPHGTNGKLRQLMVQALELFKENSTLLLASLEVFVYEPALNWIQFTNHGKKESNPEVSNENSSNWSQREKLNQCKRKLSGIMPMIITLEDLRNSSNVVKNNFITLLETRCKNEKLPIHDLSTVQQVDCLLSQATDSSLLAVTYYGWDPWF